MTKCLTETTAKEQLKKKTLILFEDMSRSRVKSITKVSDIMGLILSGVSKQDMCVLILLPPLHSVNSHIM